MMFQRPASVWLPPEVDKKGKELHARMAIYIDYYKYKPKEERNDALIYEYLYHISYMLACQHKMFERAADYDNFAAYCAGVVYGRITNEKQFIAEEGEEPMKKIGSVLNYIKASLLGMKVNYQKQEFQLVFDPELGFNNIKFESDLKSSINDSYNREYLIEDTIEEFKRLPAVVKQVVKSTPYSDDRVMSRRLYMSCMLSFLNSITLDNKLKNKLAKKELKGQSADEAKVDYLSDLSENCVILWRLDKKMYDYVDILVKRVKEKIVSGISDVKNYYEMPDEVLTQIMNSPLSDFSTHNEEDY